MFTNDPGADAVPDPADGDPGPGRVRAWISRFTVVGLLLGVVSGAAAVTLAGDPTVAKVLPWVVRSPCRSTAVQLVVAPEVLATVQAVVDGVDGQPLDGGACLRVHLRAQEPAATLQTLVSRSADALPDVWIPETSLWLGDAAPAAPRVEGHLASSPLVLAVGRERGAALGWTTGRAPTWTQVFDGTAPLAVPDIVATSEGRLTAALMAAVVPPGGDAEVVATAQLAASRRQGLLVDDVLEAAAADAADSPVVALSEHRFREASRTRPLEQVVPLGASTSFDYPVVRFGQGALTVPPREAATALVGALLSARTASIAAQHGLRPPPGSSPAAAETGRSGRDDIALPDTDTFGALLRRLQPPRTARHLVVAVDTSASMSSGLLEPGSSRIGSAVTALGTAVQLLDDSSEATLWSMAYSPRPDPEPGKPPASRPLGKAYTELVKLRRLDAEVGDGDQRAALATAVPTLPRGLRAGPTALYRTLEDAVARVDGQAGAGVLVVTDGPDGDRGGPSLAEAADAITRRAGGSHQVSLTLVGVGGKASRGSLERLADASPTGSAVVTTDALHLRATILRAAGWAP